MALINLNISFNHPAAISNTIRYGRIDNTSSPIYTTVTGVIVSPFQVQGLANGQYRVGITPVYSDGRICAEIIQDTAACTGLISFSAVLDSGNIKVTYTIDSAVPKFQVNISYPNGGTFTQQYDNGGTGSVNITPPAGVYGNYTVTIQPVCDADTGFLGSASAPAIVPVTPPNNSSLTNSTGGSIAPISMTSYASGSVLVFSQGSVANADVINFYLADAAYTQIVINYGSGTVAAASLVTGSGTYAGVLTANTITFNAPTISGGAIITIT